MKHHSHSEIAPAKDAATVILVRDDGQKPFELFLMRRHQKQRFMGGAFVFPGGALDPSDCDAALQDYMTGISLENAVRRLNESQTSPTTALGLYFTAIRETFEESGLLLADLDGNALRNLNDTANDYRIKIHDGALTLKALAVKENIRYALGLLVPYARWITPEFESTRFDTRFFLAKKPVSQTAAHDRIELVDSLWITPGAALQKNSSREILLMPPTLKTIEELSAYSSIDDLFAYVSAKTIAPILPQAFQTETSFGVLLPHDPEYTITEFKKPPRENDPSRVVLVDGRFKTLFAP